jgi:hypothetical protein
LEYLRTVFWIDEGKIRFDKGEVICNGAVQIWIRVSPVPARPWKNRYASIPVVVLRVVSIVMVPMTVFIAD